MDRRNFLKAGVAALLAALTPFKATPEEEKKFSPVKGFMVTEDNEECEITTYCAPKGVVLIGDDKRFPGLLFESLTFSVITHKNRPDNAEVSGMFWRLVGPDVVMHQLYERFTTPEECAKHSIRIGLIREDNSPLWFRISKITLSQVGLSVVAQVAHPDANKDGDSFLPQFPGDTGKMMISEMVQFIAFGEPELCDKQGASPEELIVSKATSVKERKT
jgi:hypothetical protein